MEKNAKIGIVAVVSTLVVATGTYFGIKWFKGRKKNNGNEEDKKPEVITAETNKPADEKPEEKKEEGDKK